MMALLEFRGAADSRVRRCAAVRRGVVALVLILAGFGAPAFGAATVGEPAPELAVSLLDGSAFDLAAQRGKVVVVHFWATWCIPCRKEMPALDAVYRRYRERGLVVIGLSVDRPHEAKRVPDYMKPFAFPAAILRDARTNGFGAPHLIPTTIVVDAQGVTRAVLGSEDDKLLTEKDLEDLILPLLPAPAGH